MSKSKPNSKPRKPKARKQPIVVQLDYPIEYGSRIIGQLTIKPLKGKHLRRLETPESKPIPMAMELVGLLSGEIPEVIDELEADDLMRVVEVVMGFLGGFQGTGSTS